MSVHVEWATADVPVRLMRPGQKMANGHCAEGWTLTIGDGLGALVIIEGTSDQLIGFAQRVNNAVAECGDLLRGPFPTSRSQWHLTNKAILATGPSAPPTFTYPTCADRIMGLDWGPDGTLRTRQVLAGLPRVSPRAIHAALRGLVADETLARISPGVYLYPQGASNQL